MTLYEPTIIDLLPADNFAHKTQRQWIDFFNEQGRRMISVADVYQAGKSAFGEMLDNRRRDFNEPRLVVSTMIGYSGDDLSGRIIQNYGSKVVKPSQTDVSIIPVYDNGILSQALQTKEGVSYLQALLGTSDEPEQIALALEHLSGRSASNIVLWTPNQSTRKGYSEERRSERPVRLLDFIDAFFVDGDDTFAEDGPFADGLVNGLFGNSRGLSYGVSVSPRS